MSSSAFDRPPLPDWMRGRVPFRQADPRWLRRSVVGPDAIDLRAIERHLMLTGRLPAEGVDPGGRHVFTNQDRSCGGRTRQAAVTPNERRRIAAAGGRACWRGKTAAERKAVGARLAAARRQRVRLFPAELVDGLVLDTSARHACERCGRTAKPYVQRHDAGHRASIMWRCQHHAYASARVPGVGA